MAQSRPLEPAAGVQLTVVEAVPGLSEEPPWVVDWVRDQRWFWPTAAVGVAAPTAESLKTTASMTSSPAPLATTTLLAVGGSLVVPSWTTVPNGVVWLTPE